MSAPTRPSSSQRFALNLWLPSPWIAPSFGRTDHSPLRTVRATCRCTRLSSFLFSLTFGLWPSSDNVSERFGSTHLAYLRVLSQRKPASLRHWALGPCRRLS